VLGRNRRIIYKIGLYCQEDFWPALSDEALAAAGVSAGLIRIPVGIEEIGDILSAPRSSATRW